MNEFLAMQNLSMWVLGGASWLFFFWVFVGAVLEFRKMWIQILINGGTKSNPTNQKLNLD